MRAEFFRVKRNNIKKILTKATTPLLFFIESAPLRRNLTKVVKTGCYYARVRLAMIIMMAIVIIVHFTVATSLGVVIIFTGNVYAAAEVMQ